jgi:Delta7-sterol 5-desaturase
MRELAAMPHLEDLVAPLVERWPLIWAVDAGRYVLAAALMVLGLRLARGAGVYLCRIQSRVATDRDVRREVFASLRAATVFSLVGLGIDQAARHGWLTIYTDFSVAGAIYALVTLALTLVAHDAYFYWTHRLMHLPLFFRRFHLLHHRSVTPTPWAAYAFSVPEALVQAAFLPLWLAFMPLHAVTIFGWMIFQIVRNVMGHTGVELHPAGMARSMLLGWNNTTTHHDLHHQTGRYNFGLYFTWWDRLMGTEHPDYLVEFDRVAARPAVQPAETGR